MRRLRDDVTEISETRPIYDGPSMFLDSKVVGWVHWHHFEPLGGDRIGHMVGTSRRTGDFNADCQATQEMLTDHNETCELRKQFEAEDG